MLLYLRKNSEKHSMIMTCIKESVLILQHPLKSTSFRWSKCVDGDDQGIPQVGSLGSQASIAVMNYSSLPCDFSWAES